MANQTNEDRELLEKILSLINSLDPYGFFSSEPLSPLDEYLLEAKPLADAVLETGSLDVETVDTVWMEWFMEPLTEATSPEEVERFVAAINKYVKEGSSK